MSASGVKSTDLTVLTEETLPLEIPGRGATSTAGWTLGGGMDGRRLLLRRWVWREALRCAFLRLAGRESMCSLSTWSVWSMCIITSQWNHSELELLVGGCSLLRNHLNTGRIKFGGRKFDHHTAKLSTCSYGMVGKWHIISLISQQLVNNQFNVMSRSLLVYLSECSSFSIHLRHFSRSDLKLKVKVTCITSATV